MKHLISLSLKYIRRQKLRSVLTFLCITLSVFILNTLSAYFSSTLTTLKNNEISESGSWEIRLDSVLADCEDKNEAVDVISNHAAVSDYYYWDSGSLIFYDSLDDEGRLSFIEAEFDNGKVNRVQTISEKSEIGNPELVPQDSRPLQQEINLSGDNTVVLPEWVHELGYEVGDDITITLTPVSAEYDESSPEIKAVRAKIAEENESGLSITIDDPEFDKLSEAEAENISSKSLYSYVTQQYTLNEIPFVNEKRGNSVTCTMKIAGFDTFRMPRNNAEYLPILISLENDLELDRLYSENAEMFVNADYYDNEPLIYARINDNIEFEEGLQLLFKDLGFAEQDFYLYFDGEVYHDFLLGLEFKSASVIEYLMPLIVFGLFLTFIAWAISRFVIDNAFEISVQERSAQFAALRIMGASKGQLVALVFTEAVFYCVTAVPIGVLTAFLMCRSVFASIKAVGFEAFEFDVNPVITIIGIALCIAAIFISAYTSAMWAARKLSPAEALNYGKPVKKSRRRKKAGSGKSKTNTSSKGFIVRYTLKNIFRTKKRFLISSIAMALGVLMFTVCALFVICGKRDLEHIMNSTESDFIIETYSLDALENVEETFGGNDAFEEYSVSAYIYNQLEEREDADTIARILPYSKDADMFSMAICIVDRSTYNQFAEPLTGISYDEFLSSGAALLYYGTNQWNYEDGSVLIYETSWQTSEQLGFGRNPKISFTGGTEFQLAGALCVHHAYLPSEGILIPVEMAETMALKDDLNAVVTIQATVKDVNSYEKASETIDEFAVSNNATIFNHYIENTGLKEFLSAIIKVVLVFMISIWLVGILSMVNSINTSVLNRQNELMMLRSVGMSRRQLRGTVMLESVLFSAFSAVIGSALGIVFFNIFSRYLNAYFATSATEGIAIAVVISLVINLVIAMLASIPGIRTFGSRVVK